MRLANWLIPALLISSSTLFAVNFLLVRSSIMGMGATGLFIASASIALGALLFAQEKGIFRTFFGAATLLILLSLTGAVLIILGVFTEVISIIAMVAAGMILGFALILKSKGAHSEAAAPEPAEESETKENMKSILLTVPFWVSTVAAAWLLLSGRTGEGSSSVWLTIPNLFVLAYFVAALSLCFLLFFTDLPIAIKLVLVCVFSFLSHSLFVMVWYPGRYGDPWAHLGEARYILRTGRPYAYYQILQFHLWVDLLKFKAQYSLVTFFTRMLNFDIYWVHTLLVPILWSVFTPLTAYKIAETLAVKKRKVFPFLAALVTVLFTSLVLWGAVSVPNSLGFIFFFFLITLLLLWMKHRGKRLWLIALLTTAAVFLAHPQVGAFAFMLFLLVSTIQKTPKKAIWVLSFLFILTLYPIALILNNAYLAPMGMFAINNFIALQSEIPQLLLVFAIVGLVWGIRDGFADFKFASLLFVFYLVILFEYYLSKYGMTNLPYGAGRILVMADFLLVPFAAMGILGLAVSLRRVLFPNEQSRSSNLLSRRISARTSSRILGLLLITLFLSLQAATVLYQAYPQSELVKIQPSEYELEAIQFIDSNSPDRYVVLCEPSFASLATAFLGADYGYFGSGRGVFGIPEWTYPTEQMYLQMIKTPSIGIMQEAISFAQADISYFVISVRNPDFDKISRSALEIFPAYSAFGNDQLFVFWYPLPILEKPGSLVQVTYDEGLGGEENIETTLVYMIESEMNSTLTLSGHASYNVTNFPSSWTFLELRVNNEARSFDASSDINAFVYVKDVQPTDQVVIKWLLNGNFPSVGWKDDSFKKLESWHRYELYPGTIVPTITSDGNILQMSYTFTPDAYLYYYYVTSVNVSTADYPYLLMRWKCNMPLAVASVYFEIGVLPNGSAWQHQR